MLTVERQTNWTQRPAKRPVLLLLNTKTKKNQLWWIKKLLTNWCIALLDTVRWATAVCAKCSTANFVHSVHKSVKKTLFNPRTSQFGEVETEVEQRFCYNPFIDEAPHRASFFAPMHSKLERTNVCSSARQKTKRGYIPKRAISSLLL